jgi:hypothetical protein
MSPEERCPIGLREISGGAQLNKPIHPLPERMKVVAASYPPLGQVSVLQGPEIKFTVILEVPYSSGNESWDCAIWHSTDDEPWAEVPCSVVQKDSTSVLLQDEPASSSWLYFSASLSTTQVCSFTVKFRSGQSQPWRWMREEVGMGDGIVIVQPTRCFTSNPLEDLSDIMKNLNPRWAVRSRVSQTPGTRLWSLSATVGEAQGDKSTEEDIHLGLPWGDFIRSEPDSTLPG